MRRRTERQLGEAEIALWTAVARHVRPLPGRALPVPPPDPSATAAPKASASVLIQPAGPSAPATPAKPALPPLAPLERRLRTRLKRGQEPIEGVLDLHGLRQEEAHAALIGFLERKAAQGARLVLVVTGKGGGPSADGRDQLFQERGVLRRNVPHWLRMAELRALVLGFEEADAAHGGGGALYVRLRRRREAGP